MHPKNTFWRGLLFKITGWGDDGEEARLGSTENTINTSCFLFRLARSSAEREAFSLPHSRWWFVIDKKFRKIPKNLVIVRRHQFSHTLWRVALSAALLNDLPRMRIASVHCDSPRRGTREIPFRNGALWNVLLAPRKARYPSPCALPIRRCCSD